MPNPGESTLVERIVRAKVILEGAKAAHSRNCPIDDADSLAPCNCGASETNRKIEAALEILKIS